MLHVSISVRMKSMPLDFVFFLKLFKLAVELVFVFLQLNSLTDFNRNLFLLVSFIPGLAGRGWFTAFFDHL